MVIIDLLWFLKRIIVCFDYISNLCLHPAAADVMRLADFLSAKIQVFFKNFFSPFLARALT